MSNIKSPKKLIEVALPLDDINAEAAREKSIRHGHPSTLHLWWARRPLAAARAVLFAQMVNDPGGERGYMAGLTKQQAAAKRELLFDIIRDLVKWENINNEEVLERARIAIKQSWRETCAMNKGKPGFDPDVLPAFHDPFAGGGALPLEAQRLGLESYASDLNPVAVMINKAMIEIPPRFANSKPVGPIPADEDHESLFKKEWKGAEGLAEDVRRYGSFIREQVYSTVKKFFPQVEITSNMADERPELQPYIGQRFTVIAWLWARTVKSPNPEYSEVDVPLIRSFWVSTTKGNQAWVETVVDAQSKKYQFKVRTTGRPELEETVCRQGATCIMSNMPISLDYIRTEAQAGRMKQKLFAVVVEGPRGRLYLSPDDEIEAAADVPITNIDIPNAPIDHWAGCTNCVIYGLDQFKQLFSDRQTLVLTEFSNIVSKLQDRIINDALSNGFSDDKKTLANGGNGAVAYAEAISVYLAFIIDKCTDYWSTMCTWHNSRETIGHTFGRQAIPMSWDFAETNPFSNSSGNWSGMVEWVVKVLRELPANGVGYAMQHDAAVPFDFVTDPVVSTDPPYYDNVPYSNISDYFYIWMRRSLRKIYPDLFSTITVPKMPELVANQFRHGGKDKAFSFFMTGMKSAITNLFYRANPAFPITIYYAFKASETQSGKDTTNKGWETFLQAVIDSGFAITGTWPMRTEMGARRMAVGNNALASSIVLVCRKRAVDAPEIGRREFLTELRDTMPTALNDMMGKDGISSPIAPVDLAQAAIGPGMEIFSKYKAVLNSDGTQMTVHEAMIEINRQITDYLNPDGSGFDPATLFCNDWFQQYGWNEGPFGVADTLARAKGTNVASIKISGAITAEGGIVQIMNWKDYPADYDPASDKNRSTWEACHHMIRVLNQQGEEAAGALLAKMSEDGENIRQLAYFLYTLCERKGNAEDARYYNELMTSWHAIVTASMEYMKERPQQEQFELF